MEIGDEVFIINGYKLAKGKKGVIINHSNIHEDNLNWQVKFKDINIVFKVWFREQDLKIITWSVS